MIMTPTAAMTSSSCAPPAPEQGKEKKKTKSRAGRKKKPLGFPSRPLSAYNLFFKEERAKIAAANAAFSGNSKVGFRDLARTVGRRWKSIDRLERERCENLASLESTRYKREVEEYHRKERLRLCVTPAGTSTATTSQEANLNDDATVEGKFNDAMTPPLMASPLTVAEVPASSSSTFASQQDSPLLPSSSPPFVSSASSASPLSSPAFGGGGFFPPLTSPNFPSSPNATTTMTSSTATRSSMAARLLLLRTENELFLENRRVTQLENDLAAARRLTILRIRMARRAAAMETASLLGQMRPPIAYPDLERRALEEGRANSFFLPY
uniref:HMG box domain-containing protein n=1 Tax=Odontella aurita TaxID=265563 RepID=A0A7S4M730_9STRA|mmetsp:Transcript_12640/g.37258  ORF Transcript_12640/g.37258 Transcript_12640/m.37258 type:complete len:325 (+) Transcript_12640:31-1005(+)